MTVNATKMTTGLDAAIRTVMRPVDDGAEIASGLTGEMSVPLNRLNAMWNGGEPDTDGYVVEFSVTVLDISGGATYALIVFESATSGGPRTEVARIPSITQTGVYPLSIDTAQLAPSTNWLSCGCEISADTPRRIDYSAILKLQGVNSKRRASSTSLNPRLKG